jgi:hypothetical protein
MQYDDPVEGQVQRQDQIEEAEWVENPRLDSGKQWHPAFNIRVPEGKLPLADCLHPNESEGIKEGGKISLYQKQSTGEKVAKIKGNKGKKAQDYCYFVRGWAAPLAGSEGKTW